MRAPILAAALAALTAFPASAQMQCGERSAVLAMLASDYGERPAQTGLRRDGSVLLIVSNPDTGTWTALMLTADGRACLLDAGEAWSPVAAILPGRAL